MAATVKMTPIWIGGKLAKVKDALGTARELIDSAEELAREQDRRCLPLSAGRLRAEAALMGELVSAASVKCIEQQDGYPRAMDALVRGVRSAVVELRVLHSGPPVTREDHPVWAILRRAEAALAGVS